LDPDLFTAKPGTAPLPVEALVAVEAALDTVPATQFTIAAIEQALEAERVRHDWKKGPFYGPIRLALTAKTQTPPNFSMIAALGKERSLARLRDAIAVLAVPA
jgi:glutamyl-tRNA synthetase